VRLKRFIAWFFGIRTVILNVDTFGERLKWAEVQNALRGRDHDTLFRAVGQMVEFQRQVCQSAVQDKTNLESSQLAFEAGAAASAADILAMLVELSAGDCRRNGLKEWFGGETESESE
jgi:hypothetical protein